jgi:hypothetical protein
MHELMYTLGFIHEHMRPDRDLYIKINFENVKEVCPFRSSSPRPIPSVGYWEVNAEDCTTARSLSRGRESAQGSVERRPGQPLPPRPQASQGRAVRWVRVSGARRPHSGRSGGRFAARRGCVARPRRSPGARRDAGSRRRCLRDETPECWE